MSRIEKSVAQERADYNKLLNKERDKFNNDLSETKERFERISKKRDDSTQKYRNELSDSYDSMKNENIEQSNNSVKLKRAAMDKALEEERMSHANSMGQAQKKFYNKLEDLNDEYNESNQSLAKIYDKNLEKKREMYGQGIKKNQKESTDSVNQFRDNFTKSIEEQREGLLKEKNKIQRDHSKLLKDQQVDNTNEKLKLQSRFRDHTIQRERDHAAEKEILGKLNDAEKSDIKKIFEEKVNDINEGSQENYQELMSKTNREMDRMQRDFNKERYLERNENLAEKRERDFQVGRKDEIEQRSIQQEIHAAKVGKNSLADKDAKRWKERSSDLIDQLQKQQSFYQTELKASQENAKRKTGQTLMSKELEFQGKQSNQLFNERTNAQRKEMFLNDKNDIDSRNLTTQFSTREKSLQERVKALSETFNQRTQDLNTKNVNMLEGLKSQHVADKRNFSLSVEKEFNDRQLDKLKDFEKKQRVLTEDYERQINQLTKENSKLQTMLVDTVNRVKNKGDQDIQNQQQLMIDQKKQSDRRIHDKLASREMELKFLVEELHTRYGRKLTDQENSLQTKINNLTEDYEDKIKVLMKNHRVENEEQSAANLKDRQFLQRNFEEEKKRLVEQYNNFIQNMKISHQDEVRNIKKFKELNLNARSKVA